MSVVVEVGTAAAGAWNWNAISAVATAVAAFIALLVGVLPLLMSRRRRKRQAKVLAEILVDNLSIQELHLRAAMQVPLSETWQVSAWEYQQISKATALLDAQPVMDLVSFSPNLPRYVVTALAQCAAMLALARQRRVFLAEVDPGATYTVAGDIGWYESVADDVLKLRRALHRWIGSKPQELLEDARTLAFNLRDVALINEREWRLAQAKTSVNQVSGVG
ncbi:TPA: hypothetical protein QEL30_001454 [Stenotrophomonas maltophilia]|nr:hypothetical protein [Stenotrophomonas maltophilia]ELK6804927.1 hypothetical protein [Stenotrophomonas maltophilia]HDS1582731.1 hypothetical protein [Stenotrophomonas maltophilia]HDS1596643.1 hypothetical protein [Stenotrophomonas maltophilia]